MSFHFAGAGSAADVIRQIRSHHIEGGPGHDLRELVCAMLVGTSPDYVYSVEVTGHAGTGEAASLDVRLRPVWAPAGSRSFAADAIAKAGEFAGEAAELGAANVSVTIRGALDQIAAMPAQAVEFLAGMDPVEMAGRAAELARANPELFAQVAQAAGQQLLAEVNGHALGIGLEAVDAAGLPVDAAQAVDELGELGDAGEAPPQVTGHALLGEVDDL